MHNPRSWRARVVHPCVDCVPVQLGAPWTEMSENYNSCKSKSPTGQQSLCRADQDWQIFATVALITVFAGLSLRPFKITLHAVCCSVHFLWFHLVFSFVTISTQLTRCVIIPCTFAFHCMKQDRKIHRFYIEIRIWKSFSNCKRLHPTLSTVVVLTSEEI